MEWATKNQAIKKLKTDWIEYYKSILKSPHASKQQKIYAKKEIDKLENKK